MMPADYVCDIHIHCRTCNFIGHKRAGSLLIQKLVRTHRDCDVSIDVTNITRRGRKR